MKIGEVLYETQSVVETRLVDMKLDARSVAIYKLGHWPQSLRTFRKHSSQSKGFEMTLFILDTSELATVMLYVLHGNGNSKHVETTAVILNILT